MLEVILVLLSGVAAGFVNILGAGGSLITLPVLIFLGLPPTVANGTNRIAITFQNFSALRVFRNSGQLVYEDIRILILPTLLGAALGAACAVHISDRIYQIILGAVLLLALLGSVVSPGRAGHGKRLGWLRVFFLGVGFYGGFIQAGVGFLILGGLGFLGRYPLHEANVIKVGVVFVYCILTLPIFFYMNKVELVPGLVLAVGNSVGAHLASRLNVGKNTLFIQRWVQACVALAGIKLVYDAFHG